MQETRPLSRFRLKVDTASKLPPIAARIETACVLDPVLPDVLLQPVSAAFVGPQIAVQATDLADVRLGHLELPSEVVEQANALAAEEPPAPVAGPFTVAIAVDACAPAGAAPLCDLAPIAFSPIEAVVPDAELKALRLRLTAGPNPNTKAAATAAAAAAAPPAPTPSPKPKITIRAAEPAPAKPVRSEPRRPATMVARTSAQPVEREIPEPSPTPVPVTAAEPKVIPIRKTEPPPPAPKPAADIEAELRSFVLTNSAPPAKSPVPKIGIAVAALLVMVGGGWFMFRGGTAQPQASAQGTAPVIDTAVPIAPLGGGGWTATWGADAACNKGKQIALYRPTMAISDYRIDLVGQIDRKAMGWVFRASDPRNYYVMKLEQIMPGTDPVVALVKYAVINGKETTHTQIMLPGKATLTTLFKVRTDVKGNKFTTYVQDQPVDYWTDDRIKLGGAGLYVDEGERALIKTTSFSALR